VWEGTKDGRARGACESKKRVPARQQDPRQGAIDDLRTEF
jgi:hypothetical protein